MRSGKENWKEDDILFRYFLVPEELVSPQIGPYRSFGIEAQRDGSTDWQRVAFVSDVSVDKAFVERLAAQCSAGQLDPTQLLDVVEDALAENAF